jgi:flagellar M-ring protein FliF
MVELGQQIGKTLLISALILYLVLGVLRPMLKRMNPTPPPPSPLVTEQPDNSVPHVIPAPKAPPQISQHEQTLALARQLARDDPKMVANVVKQWVAGHE